MAINISKRKVVLFLISVILMVFLGTTTSFVLNSLSEDEGFFDRFFSKIDKTERANEELLNLEDDLLEENSNQEGDETIYSGSETSSNESGETISREGNVDSGGEYEADTGTEGELDSNEEGSIEMAEPEVPSWQEPEEPEESAPMEEDEVPEEAFKITITAEGINPSSFEVDKGVKVVLSITSGDSWTHVFKFEDESLKDAIVGVAPNETRVITFYAPEEVGEYEFHCDLPGHAARGEIGEMIVK